LHRPRSGKKGLARILGWRAVWVAGPRGEKGLACWAEPIGKKVRPRE